MATKKQIKGFSDGELMRSDCKPSTRLMRHTAGIFTVGSQIFITVNIQLPTADYTLRSLVSKGEACRYHILEQRENHCPDEILPRQPLSVLDQNSNNIVNLSSPYQCDNNSLLEVYDGPNNKTEVSFLRKDDPKLTALLQQAEMLSSLALKVNTENTTQSLENAWKELNEYLVQNGGKSIAADNFEMDFGIDDFNDLIEELKNHNTVEQSSWSHPLQMEAEGRYFQKVNQLIQRQNKKVEKLCHHRK